MCTDVLLRIADDLAQFIARNCSDSDRVVEVGAGYVLEVALGLKARGLNVVLTDKEKRILGGLPVERMTYSRPGGNFTVGRACSTPSARLWRCNWPWACWPWFWARMF